MSELLVKSFIYNSPYLTVYLEDGSVYVNTNCPKDKFALLMETPNLTNEHVFFLLEEKHAEIISENIKAESLVNSLFSSAYKDLFYEQDNAVYYKGIDISIPVDLLEAMLEAMEEEATFNKLINFWKWTSLIRSPESRDSFFNYVKHNKCIITEEGYVLAIRNVEPVGSNFEEHPRLVSMVNEEYLRRRKNKKKSVFHVYTDGSEYVFKTDEIDPETDQLYYVGVSSDILSSELNMYQSVSSGKDGKQKVYKIGELAELNEEDVDWDPNNECSAGLHLHMGKYCASGFGKVTMLCLVNPMEVAACPYGDHSKFRVRAFTPLKEIKESEFENFQLTPEVQEIISEQLQVNLDKLEDMVKNTKFEDFNKKEIYTPIKYESIVKTIKESFDVKNRHFKL